MSEPREILAKALEPWIRLVRDQYYLPPNAIAQDIIAALGAGGMAIVPKEPTEEMLDAGSGDGWWDDASPYTVYRAMIESAIKENANG